jgi:hypothetical protein
LSVVGEQLSLLLELMNEFVSGGKPVAFRNNVLRDGVEVSRVLFEEAYVEDFLGITETEMRQL